MLYTNAVFSHKDNNFEPRSCIVEKVIRLSGAEYDSFARNMLRDQDFIRDNADLMTTDPDGKRHCLLVVSDDRHDGILVESQGYDYARYAAFVPNVEGLLTVGRYPALASLTRNLAEILEYLAEEYGGGERSVVDLRDLESMFGYDLMTNGVFRDVVLDMLGERPEVKEFELDKNELIIYGTPELPPPTVELSDPSVTKMDMYAYGYGWDGMIPLGKERALELFDNELEIYLLYQNGTEAAAENREDILTHDGFFGIGDSTVEIIPQYESIEVFILNRERYENGETSGEWLTLPADADTLRGLFERIGIDRPSDGAFTITAVRLPYEDCLNDHVSKYDSLDELNMLATYIGDEDNFWPEKFRTVLSSGIVPVGRGAAALINLLDADNFDEFSLIDSSDAESLGRYYAVENDEKPDDVTFAQYGYQCVKEEGGVFTEWGYIYFRNKELSQEYFGVVPDEYKIVGEALRGLRSKTQERGQDEKPSVLDRIKASRENPAPRQPRDKEAHKKDKGGTEL